MAEFDGLKRVAAFFSVVLAGSAFLALPACASFPPPESNPTPPPAPKAASGSTTVQEGEVMVKDGEAVIVRFKKPYLTPPRVVLVELRQAQSDVVRYKLDDLQLLKPEATTFKVWNRHPEQSSGSWVVVKWRAEGQLDPEAAKGGLKMPKDDTLTPQQWLAEKIKRAGGIATLETARSDAPNVELEPVIVNIDLHDTKIVDADLDELRICTRVRTLNLYHTKITDEGLPKLAALTSLTTLYLNGTRVTDAGLPALKNIKYLKELSLHQTKVTDAGLAVLAEMPGLTELTLGGSKITDAGIAQLVKLRNLKKLILGGTKVTAEGVKRLKQATPAVQIFQ